MHSVKTAPTKTAPRVAYSYLRYSSDRQGGGDTVNRQTDTAADWCRRNNYTLAEAYADHGVSAFRGKHREAGNLRRFLDDVKSAGIPPGSVLVVENLDRLSREDPWDALPLLCQIVNAGIDVQTLEPSEMRFSKGGDMTQLMSAVMEFNRSNSTSKGTSRRVGKAWGTKKGRARTEGKVETTRVPAWIEVTGDRKKVGDYMVGGEFRVVEEKARVVRKIFALALKGLGLSLIVKRLTEEGVPPIAGERIKWGRDATGKRIPVGTHKASWSKAYIHNILTGRAVLGEYQPMKREPGKPPVPDGPPIPGYFGKKGIIDPDTWQLVQKALADRRGERHRTESGKLVPSRGGRVGAKTVSLFSGLVVDARTGDRMLISNQTRGPKGKRSKRRVLVPAGSMEGRGRAISFPLDIFEPAILSELKEINPAEVLGAEPEPESAALAAEKARYEKSIQTIEADLDEHGESPLLHKRLREKEAALADVSRRLAEARSKEAHPVAESMAAAKTLIDAASDGPKKLRLRQLLRDCIDTIRVLVVPRGGWRLCQVQVEFNGPPFSVIYNNGKRNYDEPLVRKPFRDYLIVYKAAANGRKGGWTVQWSAKHDAQDVGLPFGIDTDLSNLYDVRDAEEYLQTLSVDDMRRMVGDLPPLTDEEVLRQAREANRQFREKLKKAGMWKNSESAAPVSKARRRSQ